MAKSIILIFILSAVLFSGTLSPAFSSPIFLYDPISSIEESLGTSTRSPQIAVDGDDVYTFYLDTTTQDVMRFAGTNIATPTTYSDVEVYDGFGGLLSIPQIIVYEPGEMYVGFIEDTGGFGVFIDIVRSTDGGTTFPIDGTFFVPDGLELLGVPTAGENFKIAADAGTDEVYIGFIDSGIVNFVPYTYCACADFIGVAPNPLPVLVNGATVGATNMDMIKDGTNVYLTWEDNSSGTKEIMFAHSSDNGSTWTPINLSNTLSVSSTSPKLSISGSNVYVTWIENTGINSEIHFRGSNDSGVTFGADMRLDDPAVTAESETPQIASSGSNVFIVWADNVDDLLSNQEIVLRKSIDSGATFSDLVSLSLSTGESSNPRITAQGTNLDVVWQDKTINAGNGELWFRSSADSGATFGGLQIVTDHPGSYPSPVPEIDSSSTASAVAWKQFAVGGNSFVKPATVTNIDVSFDKIEYAKTDVATITVNDVS
jgi:hypothetical protein